MTLLRSYFDFYLFLFCFRQKFFLHPPEARPRTESCSFILFFFSFFSSLSLHQLFFADGCLQLACFVVDEPIESKGIEAPFVFLLLFVEPIIFCPIDSIRFFFLVFTQCTHHCPTRVRLVLLPVLYVEIVVFSSSCLGIGMQRTPISHRNIGASENI